MPSPNRSPRTRLFGTLWVTGVLLGIAGLASAGLEDVSFGHVHLVNGHVVHHHHFFLGPHEHPESHPAQADDDDDDDDDHDPHSEPAEAHHHGAGEQDHDDSEETQLHHHHHEAPDPHHHHAPLRTATVSAAPALFQPVGCGVLAAPLLQSTPVVLVSALPAAARPLVLPSRPRGPPPSLSLPI